MEALRFIGHVPILSNGAYINGGSPPNIKKELNNKPKPLFSTFPPLAKLSTLTCTPFPSSLQRDIASCTDICDRLAWRLFSLQGDLLAHEDILRFASDKGESFNVLRDLTLAVIDCKAEISRTTELLTAAENQRRCLLARADQILELQERHNALCLDFEHLCSSLSLDPALLSDFENRLREQADILFPSRPSTPDSLPELEFQN
ncbi:hypothetical protein JR316_0012456 [Psilocybe cubensis]|uniref:Uncharacterized protein n=1 Tax=Psilocybe cubensis TaxID=181762 RepID=A0ACB8GI09_PSICU|nr:hypothetical protein JR316_0012456 [Psilocybe cubensis]KAH9475345.1 hypothetical protein JR316_0012456 [Psilocybe cubensis]